MFSGSKDDLPIRVTRLADDDISVRMEGAPSPGGLIPTPPNPNASNETLADSAKTSSSDKNDKPAASDCGSSYDPAKASVAAVHALAQVLLAATKAETTEALPSNNGLTQEAALRLLSVLQASKKSQAPADPLPQMQISSNVVTSGSAPPQPANPLPPGQSPPATSEKTEPDVLLLSNPINPPASRPGSAPVASRNAPPQMEKTPQPSILTEHTIEMPRKAEPVPPKTIAPNIIMATDVVARAAATQTATNSTSPALRADKSTQPESLAVKPAAPSNVAPPASPAPPSQEISPVAEMTPSLAPLTTGLSPVSMRMPPPEPAQKNPQDQDNIIRPHFQSRGSDAPPPVAAPPPPIPDLAAAVAGNKRDDGSAEDGWSGDGLMTCLQFILRHHGASRNLDILTADLPKIGGRLSLSGFVDATERAGFGAQVMNTKLSDIPTFILPAVLLLKGGEACMLMAREGRKITIVRPLIDDAPIKLKLKELEASYSGRAVYVRSHIKADKQEGEQDGKSTATGHWLRETLAADWPVLAQAALGTAIVNLLALALPFFTSIVFDRVVPHRALDTLNVLTIGALIMLGFDFLIRSIRAHFVDTFGKRTDVVLSNRVLSHILAARLGSGQRSAGNLANTLREFDSVREFFTSATLTTLSDLPFALLFIVVIALIAGPLALIPVASFIAIVLVSFVVVPPLDRLIQQSHKVAGGRHGRLIEILSNLETIKSVRGEAWAERQWQNYTGQSAQLSFKQRTLSQFTTHFTSFVYFFCPIATLFFGVHLLNTDAVSTGALFAVVMLNSRVLAPLGQITGLIARLRHTLTSLKAVNAIMKLPTERGDGSSLLYPDRIDGGFEVRNVHFSYPERKSEALSDVSFTVKPGEKIGILGRTGSGKSTLARLLLNLYEPQKGSVLLDNLDVRQIDTKALRRAIAYVPQDIALFAGTIRENILIGAPWADGNQILAAAKTAGLDSFIADSAEGLDRRVGERGEGLSGGQRQAVSIARALLHDPKILLLDEPTSMMDTAGEHMLKERLNHWLQNRTLVLITHRASLLSLVDRLIILERGKVVADGPRDAVLAHLRGIPVTQAAQ